MAFSLLARGGGIVPAGPRLVNLGTAPQKIGSRALQAPFLGIIFRLVQVGVYCHGGA